MSFFLKNSLLVNRFFYFLCCAVLGITLGGIMPKILFALWNIQGCVLCKVQQWIFLGIFFTSLVFFLFLASVFSFLKKYTPLIVLMVVVFWISLFFVSFYHNLIQGGFLSTPEFCQVFEAKNVADFLENSPPPCHKKTLVVLGFSAPLYNSLLGLFFGFWGLFLFYSEKKAKSS